MGCGSISYTHAYDYMLPGGWHTLWLTWGSTMVWICYIFCILGLPFLLCSQVAVVYTWLPYQVCLA